MDTEPYTGPDTKCSSANRADDQAVLPRLRRDHVYQELRRRIMLGEFALNSRLVEERLAALLGVSRTPVREALVRLLADGQVTRVDGGYFVATPDFGDLRDLYDLRITLELRGLARGVEIESVSHDVSLLEPLRDQWRAMWDDRPDPAPDFVLVDEDFHVTLLRSAGTAALTSTLESVNARIRPVRMSPSTWACWNGCSEDGWTRRLARCALMSGSRWRKWNVGLPARSPRCTCIEVVGDDDS